ncbi:MAG: 2-amino-4-hydroxy-6-hydroxymethyldihydropteridine diphosphokinase [Myxococcota bacterium]
MEKAEAEKRVFIGLGSNLGDRAKNLATALERLESVNGISVKRKSPIYSTPPYGVAQQPSFYNQVAEIATRLSPEELLEKIHLIESELGRKRSEVRFTPRIIDIDILLFGGEGTSVIYHKDLAVPHYDLHNRPFFLVPLSELDSTAVHPLVGRTIEEMLSEFEPEEINSCVRVSEG